LREVNSKWVRTAALGLAGILAALSCRSDATSPSGTREGELPPSLTVTFPAGPTMTAGAPSAISLTAVSMKAKSCEVTGSSGMTFTPAANPDSAWTATPSDTGTAHVDVSCRDLGNHKVSVTDTVRVFVMPSVTPDMAGTVPVGAGDSVDVTYDSTDTRLVDVACKNCGSYGSVTRVGPNVVRFHAQVAVSDGAIRAVCFIVHGLDGHYTQQQCVGVAVTAAQLPPHSIPWAIRQSEVVALHTMPVATYEYSGRSIHPDFMRVKSPWSNNACWLVFTPYPGSNGNLENPSLAKSGDCEHWKPAPGVRAPLYDKPPVGYNSDPDLVFDSTGGCLGVVFRQVIAENDIVIAKSCDGTTWSDSPRLLFSAPDHSAVSPTVAAGPDGVSRIWYVDAGPKGCASLSNVVKMRVARPSSSSSLDSLAFGDEVATDLVQAGYVIWHIKVRYLPSKNMYLAMYAAFPSVSGATCSTNDLFVATSADGLHWQSFPVPIINKLDRRFNFVSLYRSSFSYNPNTDLLRTIASGLEDDWGEYGVTYNFTALMNALNLSTTASGLQLVPSKKLVRKADAVPRTVKMEDQPRRRPHH